MLSLKQTVSMKSLHQRFTAAYVQLSRLTGYQGLQLLEPIEYKDVDAQPDPDLVTWGNRMIAMQDETLMRWSSYLINNQA